MKTIRMIGDRTITDEELAEHNRIYNFEHTKFINTVNARNKGLVPCGPNGRGCDTSRIWDQMEIFDIETPYFGKDSRCYIGAITVCRICGYNWMYDANI